MSAIDLDSIVEALEGMAGSQRASFRGNTRPVLSDLLKWRYQPSHRTRSWEITIGRGRIDAEQALRDSPSLAHRQAELFAEAYKAARREAALETSLSVGTLPEQSPCEVATVLDPEWWPEDLA